MTNANPKISPDLKCTVKTTVVKELEFTVFQAYKKDVVDLTAYLPNGKRFIDFRVPTDADKWLESQYYGIANGITHGYTPTESVAGGNRLIIGDIPQPRRVTFEFVGHDIHATKGEYFCASDIIEGFERWNGSNLTSGVYDVWKLVEDTDALQEKKGC